MIINQCPSNHYSSCRSLLSLHRRRFRVLPRHRFNSVFELDGLDGPLLETPDVWNNLLAIIDVHSEQSIISFTAIIDSELTPRRNYGTEARRLLQRIHGVYQSRTLPCSGVEYRSLSP
jgi:hypothetical protein